MTSRSDKFERTVWRIHRLLEEDGAEVTWNDRVSDPDTPGRTRQIDVLVKRPGYLFMVECRDHSAPQDVKWIEELHGRQQSLNANGIGAASTSGFTTTAVKKAARFGIPLFNLSTIADSEITEWGRSVNVTLYAYRYENFVVRLHFPSGSKRPVDAAAISDELAHYFGLRAIFSPASDILDTKNLLLSPAARVNFGVQFHIPGLILQGLPVALLETNGTGYLEKIELQIPMTSVYKPSDHSDTSRQLFVQQFNLGETQAIHKNDVLAITLDLSALSLPPYWQFRYCQVSGSKVYDMDSFEILHPERIPMKIDRLHIEICEEASE